MKNYELHITFKYKDQAELARIKDFCLNRVNWKFSCILNDPLLGDKPFAYATDHCRSLELAAQHLSDTADLAIELGLNPIRMKIEDIVYDVRIPLTDEKMLCKVEA